MSLLPGPRTLSARLTLGLFALVLLAHLAGALTGWKHGIMPGNTFRQTQTAVSTFFIQQENRLVLDYPTPILGKPWSVPMEFPLYQWSVVLLNRLTGSSLVESARTISLLCFYLALPAIWLALREWGLDPARRWLVLAFIPAAPVYVFYSRAFLIESMAWMFACWFLACLYLGVNRRKVGWLALACAAGCAGGMVKVTTLLLFLIPVGAGMLRLAWRAARGVPGERANARQQLMLAVITLIPPVLCTAWWTAHADGLKMLNPAANMLHSVPQRAYLFGQLSDRFASDYWTRWSDLTSRVAVHPVVLVGVLLTGMLSPRRWRWPVIGGLALFALAPAIFPFLYAWHDYYYFANTGFLTLAAGCAAIALLESRLPRLLAGGLIVAALALQAELFIKHYLPEQQVNGNGDTSLTQLLYDLTDRADVLVVAGQDWNPMIPWSAQRRALMIRRGHENRPDYLRQAFGDLRGEFTAALVLTEDARGNASVVTLASDILDIHPEPFLEFKDSVVYVNRALRDEWSRRASSFTYGEIQLRQRSEAIAPILSGSPAKLHGKSMFARMSPMPARFEVPYNLNSLWPTPKSVFNAHATTHLWFEASLGQHQARIEFGIFDTVWQGKDKTDGVEFVLSVLRPDGSEQRVWSRFLNPAGVVPDRGLQEATAQFDLPAGAQLKLSTLPGPNGSAAYDWAYIGAVDIR